MACASELTRLEKLLKHDRLIVLTSVAVLVCLAWLYTLAGAGMSMNAFEMTQMPVLFFNNAGSPLSASWDPQYFILVLSMWWIMMIAMMLPSATPVILLAAALNRRSVSNRAPYGKTLYFTLGYLLAWLGFSLIAVMSQWWLESQQLMTAMMQNKSHLLAAGLLFAAGAWQLTPIKHACLRHCQSPVRFLVSYRRPGNLGALKMGLHHGCYCLGCCWLLMCLLFVVCVMNLFWIIGLGLFVILEKYFVKGLLFSRVSGIILCMAGLGLVII